MILQGGGSFIGFDLGVLGEGEVFGEEEVCEV